jgi:hypothetical protein
VPDTKNRKKEDEKKIRSGVWAGCVLVSNQCIVYQL